ncbi:MAG: flagellar assembly protein FliW [Acidobacteria bacterium]|nr:flagellar assembly protein FliW [Acidobacteriota bacterium]MBI3657028.1 flagellar assembly protein FliW [Acidobacteriota bacterium]
MQIQSLSFGELTYFADDVIRFAEGLPGFPNLKQFIFLDSEEFQPFQYLQAIDDPPIAFPLISPYLVKKDYHVVISAEDAMPLHAETPEDLLIYSIVTIPTQIEHTTINLLAPVVLNFRHMIGKQIILHGSDHPVQFPILQEQEALAAP